MQFAEYCDTTASYIGHIETGKKFPSMDMIEKMALILKIKPYHFFVDRTEQDPQNGIESSYPRLPEAMKNEIKSQMDLSISGIVTEILKKY